MFKKYLIVVLTFLVLNLSLSSVAFAQTQSEKDTKFAAKVKTNITKLGTGTDAKIQVKLKDGNRLKGYVSQINENSFVVTDEKTNVATEIPYPNAKQVKGNNLNTGVAIAIAAGILVGIIIVFAIVGESR